MTDSTSPSSTEQPASSALLTLGLALGAAVLFGYGLSVNLPKWDFGRLMGVYIAAFFVVAQAVAVIFFHERLQLPTIVGVSLIIAGGILITVWRVQ